MRDFEFLQPSTIAEASRMLADYGDDCRAMAGGSALMLAMRQRMLMPTHIVSLAKLDALHGIEFDAQKGLRIGALSTHNDVARALVIQQHYPMLSGVAAGLANPQVRNQGTIGGNLCYGDPATDPPSCLLAMDATVTIANAAGTRVLRMQDFLVDYFVTALQPDEVLVEIRIPAPSNDSEGRYTRFLRTAAQHRPLVNVALYLRRSGAVGTDIKLVTGASTPIPMRMTRAEAYLEGRAVTPDVAAIAAEMVATDIDPLSDPRGDADYRRSMVRVITERTISSLFELTQT